MTDADGNVYKTVKIGKQVWMAENLNYKTGNSWCYDNDPANCKRYGRLYDWYTAMVACPGGWHLPSDDEWRVLIYYLGGKPVAGRRMKSTSSLWLLPNEFNATNSSGFSALPGGARTYFRNFDFLGLYAYFWSSTVLYSDSAWGRLLVYDEDWALRNYYYKGRGCSCRCVKD